jgi:REP element-mobilizing transposase RayT
LVFACSILPEHVHMVIGRHGRGAERIVGHLKSAATRWLAAEGLHPFREEVKRDGRRQSPWAEKCWKVFLDSAEDIGRAVRYVEENPVKEGTGRQAWSFVWGGRG